MRRQRIAMVQTKDQYIMVHRAVKELFEEQLKIIESHPYANVDQLGLPIDIKSDLEEHTYETVEYNPTPVDLAQYQPSTSVPPIPPPHGDLSKLTKTELKPEDNPCRQDERTSRWLKQQKIDDITVLSSDGEEIVEPPRHKKSGHLRSAILRKPSIVKIKSFFEKSKDGKKSGGTNLSRAKSDVSSSRFYAFNNISFPFRGSHSSKSPTPSLDTAAASIPPPIRTTNSSSSSKVLFLTTPSTNPSKESKPPKPPIFAKPLLPIKRSKSLKLGKEDSFEQMDKTVRKQPLGGITDNHTAQTSSTSITNVSSYPIKVSIKQVDIPQMKKPVSTSVKPEIQTATTVELNKQTSASSSSSSSGSWQKTKALGGEDVTSSLFSKPLIPPKSQFLLKETNPGTPPANNRIKMGVAKEMEDVLDFGKQHSKYDKLKKYDTVTIINSPTNKRTSLSRSQSHVWQPTKVQMPFRIFSDENIHQSVVTPETKLNHHILHHEPVNLSSSAVLSQSNGNVHERRTFGSFDESCSKASGGAIFTIGGSHSTSSHDQSSPIPDMETCNKNTNASDSKPMVRRRVPKTNPYANYTPTGLGISTPPYPQSPPAPMSSQQGIKVASVVPSIPPVPSSTTTIAMESSRIPKDLPQLKPGYSRSRENSSDSSSNTATPRSSLPGTPTQTIDSTYAQIMRSNMQGLGLSNKGFPRNNGIAPQKSILKGSLSSTPSESDERLDTGRQASSSPSHTSKSLHPSIITPPQKINTVRTVMGIRERRNSFRQAVCKDKEDQPQPGPKDEIFRDNFLPNNSRLFADGGHPPQKSGDRAASSSKASGLIRPHKDYEPIWPSENGHYSNGGGFAIVSDDSYINRAPLKPQTQPQNFSINGINYGGLPEQRGINNTSTDMFGAQSRGHSEDRTLHGMHPKQNSQPFQSRFDEIKLLLEELKAPNAITQTQNKLSATSQNSSYFLEGPTPTLKEPASGSNPPVSLKYQRSLRTPSKPQYPPGLSCFTFKKPSSMESLTDSIHYDMMQPSVLTEDTTPLIKQNGFHVTASSTSGQGQGRSSNDYVSLRQGRSYGPSSSSSSIPRMELHNSHIGSNGIPVAPPRTKKLQKSNSISTEGSKTTPNSMDMTFSTSHGPDGRASGSNNLPEVVRCAKDSSFQQQHNQSSGNMTPSSSTKHINKAMGLFQATAANVRSKLNSWNEPKDKSNGDGSCSEKDDHDGGN